MAVGEIDAITTESIAESIAESIIDGACDPMGPLLMGCASGQSGRALLQGALGWCTQPWHRHGGLTLPLCAALTLGLSRVSRQALCYDYAYDR